MVKVTFVNSSSYSINIYVTASIDRHSTDWYSLSPNCTESFDRTAGRVYGINIDYRGDALGYAIRWPQSNRVLHFNGNTLDGTTKIGWN